MFAQYNSVLTLEALATKFLLSHGCSPDGRPVESYDPRQVGFEMRLAHVAPRGDLADTIAARSE